MMQFINQNVGIIAFAALALSIIVLYKGGSAHKDALCDRERLWSLPNSSIASRDAALLAYASRYAANGDVAMRVMQVVFQNIGEPGCGYDIAELEKVANKVIEVQNAKVGTKK